MNDNTDIEAVIQEARNELAAAGQSVDLNTLLHLFAWRWVMACRGVTKGYLRYPPEHAVREAKPERPVIERTAAEIAEAAARGEPV